MVKFINFDILDLLIGLFILVCLLFVFWRQKRSVSYMLFFSIFWIYLLVVVSTVIFPVVINLGSSDEIFSPNINLIPFYFGACSIPFSCIEGVIMNILLTIPFGFGINFLLRVKPKFFFWLAPITGLLFEFSKIIISLTFRSGFRAVDINDVIFNGTGVLIGYAIFRVFAWMYLKVAEYFGLKHKWLFADIYLVTLRAHAIGKSKNA